MQASLDARLSCARGEGAFLNTETGNTLFTFCEDGTKELLKEYLKANYENLKTGLPSERELFLVTGTHMTKNWEIAIFRSNSNSFGSEISVDGGIIEGQFSVDWRSLRGGLYDFQTGHTHPAQPMPDHTLTRSFGACCHCDQSVENQCIFIQGWRVKKLWGSKMTTLVSVGETRSTSFKIQFNRSLSSRKETAQREPSSSSQRTGEPSSSLHWTEETPSSSQRTGEPDPESQIVIEEAEGTPNDSDFVSKSSQHCSLKSDIHFSPTSLMLSLL